MALKRSYASCHAPGGRGTPEADLSFTEETQRRRSQVSWREWTWQSPPRGPRARTVEQRVPGRFSFDEDPSQQRHQEQGEGSNPDDGPGTATTGSGRRSLIEIHTAAHGISWLLAALAPTSAAGAC